MPAAGFGSPFPVAASAPPRYAPAFASQPPASYSLPPASPPYRPSVAQPQFPAPRVVRGQQPDEPPSAPPPGPVLHQPPLRMPSPQELGVAEMKRAANVGIDWMAVHNQLDRLGATCFHLEQAAAGGCRITCLLPTNQPGRMHRIEAEAPTEAEAVHLALSKVQQWADGGR